MKLYYSFHDALQIPVTAEEFIYFFGLRARYLL